MALLQKKGTRKVRQEQLGKKHGVDWREAKQAGRKEEIKNLQPLLSKGGKPKSRKAGPMPKDRRRGKGGKQKRG